MVWGSAYIVGLKLKYGNKLYKQSFEFFERNGFLKAGKKKFFQFDIEDISNLHYSLYFIPFLAHCGIELA